MELNIIGRKTAWYSFLIGTSMLLSYIIFSIANWICYWICDYLIISGTEGYIFMASLLFICVAFCINFVILIPVIVYSIIDAENRMQFLETAFMMIVNIPIAVAYFFMVLNIPTPMMTW